MFLWMNFVESLVYSKKTYLTIYEFLQIIYFILIRFSIQIWKGKCFSAENAFVLLSKHIELYKFTKATLSERILKEMSLRPCDSSNILQPSDLLLKLIVRKSFFIQ